jgi:phosphatidylinositol-3-phosphatase
MKKTILALGLLVPAMASQGFAAEGPVPTGIPHLDHVFVIVMENHAYGQIFNNPNTPFINAFAASANLATNFFAIGHPSLTNYLEMTGGSNFGVRSVNWPRIWDHWLRCEASCSVASDGARYDQVT